MPPRLACLPRCGLGCGWVGRGGAGECGEGGWDGDGHTDLGRVGLVEQSTMGVERGGVGLGGERVGVTITVGLGIGLIKHTITCYPVVGAAL